MLVFSVPWITLASQSLLSLRAVPGVSSKSPEAKSTSSPNSVIGRLTVARCSVNILDLIFIRNRLTQPVGTGDNWRADCNGDDRINILDLIMVRASLNTACN